MQDRHQESVSAAAIVGVATLVVLGPLLAWGLRRLRVAGAALAGGVLAGLIAGPAFLGRIAPETYTRVFAGPPDVLHALELSQGAMRAEAFVAAQRAASIDEGERAERSAALERDQRAWNEAQAEHRRPFSAAALLGAVIVFASSMSVGARRGRINVSDALVAAWSALVPALAVVALFALRGEPLLTSSTAIVVAACACGAWCITREDRIVLRREAPGGARGTATIAALATTLACVIALPAVVGGPSPTTMALALLALLIGACTPLLPRWRTLAASARVVAIPAVAALLAVQVDPAHDLSVWLVVVLFLIAEDGRWLGAFIGHQLSERASGPMRQAMAGLGVGPTMVAFAAVGTAVQAIAAPLLLALLLAAVLTDCFAPIRLRVAQRLERAGAELDDA